MIPARHRNGAHKGSRKVLMAAKTPKTNAVVDIQAL